MWLNPILVSYQNHSVAGTANPITAKVRCAGFTLKFLKIKFQSIGKKKDLQTKTLFLFGKMIYFFIFPDFLDFLSFLSFFSFFTFFCFGSTITRLSHFLQRRVLSSSVSFFFRDRMIDSSLSSSNPCNWNSER